MLDDVVEFGTPFDNAEFELGNSFEFAVRFPYTAADCPGECLIEDEYGWTGC